MFDKETIEKAKTAIEKHGAWMSVTSFVVSAGELQNALCEYALFGENISQVADAIADVKIVLDSLTGIHDCKEAVEEYRSKKIDRILADRYLI